jgi:hypothetical protein
VPLLLALAAIRLCVYALRNVFGDNKPLPLSERAVGFAIWGALILYYLGVTQEIGSTLEEAEFSIGRSRVNLLELGRDALIMVLALMISLWISGLIEQWVLRMPNVDRNVRVVTAKFFRAVILIVGGPLSLPLLGSRPHRAVRVRRALGVGTQARSASSPAIVASSPSFSTSRSPRRHDHRRHAQFGPKVTSRYVVVRSRRDRGNRARRTLVKPRCSTLVLPRDCLHCLCRQLRQRSRPRYG